MTSYHLESGMSNISIRSSGIKGRGVFAEKRFTRGEMVDAVPVVVIPDPQYELLERTPLGNYYLYWNEQASAIAFGCASFINHSKTPNAEMRRDVEQGLVKVFALRDIWPGEEITVSYHCKPWFKVVE